MFDEPSDAELVSARRPIAAAGLHAARIAAATRFIDGPGRGLGRPPLVVDLFMARNQADERWERISPFEQRWALFVLRLVDGVIDPVEAVADARSRGCSWAKIGSALDVSAQAAQQRFGNRVN